MKFVLRAGQLSSCSFTIDSLPGTDLMLTPKNVIFRVFKSMLSEALCCCSELLQVCRELYEGPGGNLVDGLPPAPVSEAAKL